jgi:predicted regulator of Ras-like GTPase activity (Roadblock/LC7/MglB family)
MSREVYSTALKTTLTEVKKMCPDITSSFIFGKDGTMIAGDGEADALMEKTVHSFQDLAKKSVVIGRLDALSVDGDKGKTHIYRLDEMYLVVSASPHMDTTYLRAVTNVIVPTVLKVLENIAPTPLKFTPTQQLMVDTLTGFFAGNDAQIDDAYLTEWSKHFHGKDVNEVEIETSDGKTSRCGVKTISDSKRQGKKLILIPEKACRALDAKKGELVKVKPVTS